MKNDLLKIVKNLNGHVFTLGITDDDLILAIQNSTKITNYLMLNINNSVQYERSDKHKPVKNIRIKKIKKKTKKKKIDYSVCEISDCKDHFRTLINDTIYFNKEKIYYYGKQSDYDIDSLIKKYRRYNVLIEIRKYSNDDFILMIDTSKAKTNRIKGFFYRIVDFFEFVFDAMTNFLLS